jgi:predicted HTH domain antitoxin
MVEEMITVKIPQQWFIGLESEQEIMIEEIIQLGIQQLKIRRALELYRSGAGSLGYVAEKMGLSKRELICEARARGITPRFDEPMINEELGL